MKKIISALLVLIVLTTNILALSSCGSMAEAETDNGVAVKRGLFNKDYAVTGRGDVDGDELVVESNYNGTPITRIVAKAFAKNTSIRVAVIPSNVKDIEDRAFAECVSLIAVYIGYNNDFTPDGNKSALESIGRFAFYACAELSHIYYNGTMADFKAVSKKTSKVNCWNRQTQEPLTIVCTDGSLEYRWQMSSDPKEIPNEVTTKKESEGLKFELNKDGNSYSVKGIGTCRDTNIVIPRTYNGKPVTAISTSAFLYNNSIVSVDIPEGVTSIGSSAFAFCTMLTDVTIPSSVKNVDFQAFYGSNKIRYNEYGNALYLGNDQNPYYVLVELKSENTTDCSIPAETKVIVRMALLQYKKVSSFTVSSNNTVYKSINGSLYSKDGKHLIRYAMGSTNSSFTVPSGVTVIDHAAFIHSSSLKNVVISNGVQLISEQAFALCPSLETISVPKSVTSVETAYVGDCPSFKYVQYSGTMAQWKNIFNEDADVIVGSSTPKYAVRCIDGEFYIPGF